jgi:Family of unknown function (DUF6879)
VERISLEEFRALFRQHRDAIHLEVKETYSVSQEDEPFRKFMAGEADDDQWRAGYFRVIRDAVDGQTTVRRVRVVTEPLNDYARFLLHITPGNIAAGEDVRYLPRDRAVGIELPDDDCWLFDLDTLVLTRFGGRTTGFVLTDDPGQVKTYREACSRVWERAIPYADYAHSR